MPMTALSSAAAAAAAAASAEDSSSAAPSSSPNAVVEEEEEDEKEAVATLRGNCWPIITMSASARSINPAYCEALMLLLLLLLPTVAGVTTMGPCPHSHAGSLGGAGLSVITVAPQHANVDGLR